ncbi:MAG: UDP-N-acetylmuramate--L-alanine ligase [Deinococcales bacterium]
MNARHLHFVGVGGVSMHALALWYAREGYRVSGCDALGGPVLAMLAGRGLEVCEGHDPSHATDADVVVHSMAIPPDHPELVAARRRGARVVKRIELLAELFAARRTIAITGTHGKSTTTGMAASLLLGLETDPSVQVGARLPAIDGNVRYGAGPDLVAEVDESDPGFAALESSVAVVTNLEDDHIAGPYDERRNYHASLEDLQAAARRFAANGRTLLYCADWPGLEGLFGRHPHALRYGECQDAEFRIEALTLSGEGSRFRLTRPERPPLEVALSVPGRHNVLNATAALAAVELAGYDASGGLDALAAYGGVGRRWERWGEPRGALIVDDYAHHPTEVEATLRTARATGRRVRAVLQPHRWVRTARHWRALADAAALADEVVVLDIYSAGEAPIPGVSVERIVERLRTRGVQASHHDLASAEAYLAGTLDAGVLVVTLGAGDVWRVAKGLASIEEPHAAR